MKVRGQTAKNVTLDLLEGAITWNLGKCIVVENLGVNLLVGEPGKIDNKINTKPETRTLETLNSLGQMVSVPYYENGSTDPPFHPREADNGVSRTSGGGEVGDPTSRDETQKDPDPKVVRPKRKAALKQRELMKNLVNSSTFKTHVTDKSPTHPFNYEEWVNWD